MEVPEGEPYKLPIAAPTGAASDDSDLPPEVQFEAAQAPTELPPWHTARKQYIREEFWARNSRRLIKRKHEQGRQASGTGTEVRYLTLPGSDYVDVRILGELCRRHPDCSLNMTGFLASQEGSRERNRANLRQEALAHSGLISKSSHTMARRFEEVASDNSAAYREMMRRGPFDIVNIDACGSLARPSDTRAMRPVDAIFRIMDYQVRRQAEPWLLFVTADVRHDSLEPEMLSRLCDAIRSNARDHDGFGERLLAQLGRENDSEVEDWIQVGSTGSGAEFLKLFAVGFGKWILSLGEEQSRQVKMEAAYCYSTERKGCETPTMVHLGFRIDPPASGIFDRHHVARVEPRVTTGHRSLSLRVVDKVSQMTDLDAKMSEEPDLRQQMINLLRTELKHAGYPDSILQNLDSLER